MYVQAGDKVILTSTEEPTLRPYVDKEWLVKTVMYAIHPASAIIQRDNLQASVYIRSLDVCPPDTSPFNYGDTVLIRSEEDAKPLLKKYRWYPYQLNTELFSQTGKICGYDSRNQFLRVRCLNGHQGWFPPVCLLPLDYKGERFFYPLEQVKYKGKTLTITEIRKSKFNYGQLLKIDGEWIASTDVESLT